MSEKPNNERPADLAVQDSVGGMAKRLLNPPTCAIWPNGVPPPCTSRGPSSFGAT